MSQHDSLYESFPEIHLDSTHELAEKSRAEIKRYKETAKRLQSGYHKDIKKGTIIGVVLLLLVVGAAVFFGVTQIMGDKNDAESATEQTAVSSETIADETETESETTIVTTVEDEQIVQENVTETEPPVTDDAVISQTEPVETTIVSATENENAFSGYKVGDIVWFSGDRHYTTSFENAKYDYCNPGKVIITGIEPDAAHPYHVQTAEIGCDTFGWVNEDDIEPLSE